MTARIAQEPIAVGVTLNPLLAQDVKTSTRPVEGIGKSSADPKGNNPHEDHQAPAEISARPPGKDPSIPPQALFDAALIAAENKPTVAPVVAPPKEAAPGVELKGTEPADEVDQSKAPTAQEKVVVANTDEPQTEEPASLTFAYFGADPESEPA